MPLTSLSITYFFMEVLLVEISSAPPFSNIASGAASVDNAILGGRFRQAGGVGDRGRGSLLSGWFDLFLDRAAGGLLCGGLEVEPLRQSESGTAVLDQDGLRRWAAGDRRRGGEGRTGPGAFRGRARRSRALSVRGTRDRFCDREEQGGDSVGARASRQWLADRRRLHGRRDPGGGGPSRRTPRH